MTPPSGRASGSTASGHPPSFARFLLYLTAMVLLGLVGLLVFAVPAQRTYRRLKAEYEAGLGDRGRWVVSWGYVLVGAALLVTVPLTGALLYMAVRTLVA